MCNKYFLKYFLNLTNREKDDTLEMSYEVNGSYKK